MVGREASFRYNSSVHIKPSNGAVVGREASFRYNLQAIVAVAVVLWLVGKRRSDTIKLPNVTAD